MRITSLQNERVKHVIKLRRRPHRDRDRQIIIEGYREVKQALDHGHPMHALFTAPDWFQGVNEPALIARCREAGIEVAECTREVFARMAYRDRPEGLLALGAPLGRRLDELTLPETPLVVVAEAIEKPGNLGTILRSADGAGADAVIVCDPCTDLDNPNVIRASIGLCFVVPTVQADGAAVRTWLADRGLQRVAATPHADTLYTAADLARPTAILVGTEQVGLSETWLAAADVQVRIPMQGAADSLNVATATTLLLYEAARQRAFSSSARVKSSQ